MRSLAKYVWVIVALAFVGGFLLYETSGLIGRTPVTSTTPVAVVNGHEILYNAYIQRVQNETSQQQQAGRNLSQDDIRRIENGVFDQMVSDVLMEQEYRRRGITVSDDEVREFARYAPPNWITSAPELQTEGRFDPAKYARLLGSPQARQSGLLLQLEAYYRAEIPKQKLLEQVTSGVYVSDAELWRTYRDLHDSVQVSFVALRPNPADTAAAKGISDADLRGYFDAHKADFQHPGRATLSVVVIRKLVTTADTNAARQKALQLRGEITGGAKFEDVAKRESADTLSGANGGDLGKGVKGRFVSEFEKAAYALKVGEISQPVQSQFGFHLIRLDDRKGDTIGVHHILVRIEPSDSEATRYGRDADTLSRMAAQADQPKKLDSAAAKLHLPVQHVAAFEDEPAMLDGRVVPSVSAWAFGGAKPGETSELFDDESGYYLARLDSLTPGGAPVFENVKADVRNRVMVSRQLDQLMTQAQQVAAAAATSSLESAAQSKGLKVEQTGLFTRLAPAPGLGTYTEAAGAAFGLPTQAVSAPIKTEGTVFVLRVDKRINADSAAWFKDKESERQQRIQQLRQQRWQLYQQDIRRSAKIDDRRKAINAMARRASA
jgi:peptidyl-prolyl cis-trans isomerase D